MTVLVTGGAGYIGSHTIVELLLEGHEVVCLDNFCNSSPRSIDRIIEICKIKGLLNPPITHWLTDCARVADVKTVFKNVLDHALHTSIC